MAQDLGVSGYVENMGYGGILASLFNRAREIGADVVVTLDRSFKRTHLFENLYNVDSVSLFW